MCAHSLIQSHTHSQTYPYLYNPIWTARYGVAMVSRRTYTRMIMHTLTNQNTQTNTRQHTHTHTRTRVSGNIKLLRSAKPKTDASLSLLFLSLPSERAASTPPDQKSPKFHQKSPTFHQKSPKFHRKSPTFYKNKTISRVLFFSCVLPLSFSSEWIHRFTQIGPRGRQMLLQHCAEKKVEQHVIQTVRRIEREKNKRKIN